MAYSYPMMLDVTERPIVIIGGGAVACRKAGRLVESGASRLQAVAPEFDPAMPRQVKRISAQYRPAHLDGAQLAFAATDSKEINDAVVRDARSRGILVCRADANDREPGDFSVPASFADDLIVVSVSAGGSPATAVFVRDKLKEAFNPWWAQWARVTGALRPMVLDAPGLTSERRRSILRELATDEALDIFKQGGRDGLLNWIKSRHPELPR